MSKKSKRARKKRKKRRTEPSASRVRAQRQPQPRQASVSTAPDRTWWWVGSGAVAVLLIAVVLWFTVGPGKSVPPMATVMSTPTSLPTATVPPIPTESTGTEGTEKESASMLANPADRNNMYNAPPAMQIDPGKTYIATLETEKGDIVVELFAERVPNTVNNFVFLARQGFYDNTTFHRVISGFMAQAGDPTGTGRGGPGYRFDDEFHPDLKHDRSGIFSMANSGANTNGSQFFITYAPVPWLDAYDESGNLKDCARRDVSCHAVFGRVIEGMDVLQAVTPRDPSRASTPGDLIKTIRIEERTVESRGKGEGVNGRRPA